ncbi:MAG TPA: NADP-dependent phosphogluconate dehydrogenase [Ardenticatenaceae bacterium]|nr:NADP-dependent phosphogluconate dehydrogenase [Ardenticatenaceae bacterium]
MANIGVIGLAVMGQNLARNIARNGFDVVVYNRTTATAEAFIAEHGASNLVPAYTLPEFVAALERPRRLLLMVKAGPAVDNIIGQLKPELDAGDIIMDGGNSYFLDTERRAQALAADGIHFLGTGVSGGEEGALWGPSIMPGGARDAYDVVAPILRTIAAKAADGEPCVSYLGPGGAGHYVKMVHNGIEYAIMQAIAEVYDVLHHVGRLSPAQLAQLFAEWNSAELSSFLVEITAHIFQVRDADTGDMLVDLILDKAQQKGTGKWTSQNAFDLGVPVPGITAAVEARGLSARKDERVRASEVLTGPQPVPPNGRDLAGPARAALYSAMVASYAQGFALLQGASEEYHYGYDLGEVAKVWRAGCIIRAGLLEAIHDAFAADPTLPNLLLAPPLREALAERQEGWRHLLATGIQNGIPLPVLGASLAYYDGYRTARLPANLIQAQRDYFGSHTYERIDQPGVFHTDWPLALTE